MAMRFYACVRRVLVLACTTALLSQPVLAEFFAPIEPQQAGFDPDRLTRVDEFLNAAVSEGRMPGFAMLLARHGQLVSLKTYGKKNLATGEPIAPDTIFRIASMSKMVTGVALMILFEENKFNLDDPVAKFIPEFAHLKVYAGKDAAGRPKLIDPVHPPTMRELMSHSAGFGYGSTDDPADQILADQKPFRCARPARIRQAGGQGAADLSARHHLALQRASRYFRLYRGKAVRHAVRRIP